MLRLSISYGYAWSVWEDKGGLQPDIESLALPRKFVAPLKAWTFREDMTLHEPMFTGRKEYDEEGRALAMQLQQAVGDRLHVMFHHWEAFDPKQWRYQWREEDLLTGDCEEYWLNEDLPEDVVTKVVKIYPDFCGAYLWDLDGCCIGNEDPAFLDDLDARFTAWSERWDACYDIDNWKLDKARLAEEQFDVQGIALATELKRAVGPTVKVIYYCTLSETTLEVLEDGKTIECPPDTDFRQWALDNSNILSP